MRNTGRRRGGFPWMDANVPSIRPALRRAAVLVVGALFAASCTSSSPDAQESATEVSSATSTTPTPVGDGLPEGPSALRGDRFATEFPEPLIDPLNIIPGGPPPDGIPPIDNPQFVTVDEADEWLSDSEPVLVVDVDGDVRAYPVQILMWHEIVNDTVGGVPLAITYCPLCNSAITFVRRVRGVETTFGTSGSLYLANLVMYDRATETLWNQLDGRAVVGLLAGEELEQIPGPMVGWDDVKGAYPDIQVLDRNRTGSERSYGTNPYTGLDNPDGDPFLFTRDVDIRAKAMQRIVALEADGKAFAWTLDAISSDSAAAVATTATINETPAVFFWKTGQGSALDTSSIADGREVGTVSLFESNVDGQALTFESDGEAFIDSETGSTWNIAGTATDGPLAGTQLTPLTFVRTFWFSWSTFRPDTDLVG